MTPTLFDATYTTTHSSLPLPSALPVQENQAPNWQHAINTIADAMIQADSEEKARLLHRLGYIALLLGDVRTKALEAFTLMQDQADQLAQPALQAMAHIGLAAVYDTLGQRHKSLEHARQAARLATVAKDQRLLAMALNGEAQFYKENGQNRRAHELYHVIGQIGQELNDDELRVISKIGLGRTTPMTQAPIAVEHYEQAIVMAKLHGDEGALVVCYNNLADWKINTGCYEEALTLREECLRISRKINSKIGVGRSLIGMAKAHTLLENLSEARKLLNKGLPTVLSAADLEGELHSSLNLAHLYVRNDDIPRACELYRQVLERSLAAPDHACAIFAQNALEQLASDEMPLPAILPRHPVTQAFLGSLNETEIAELGVIYPTGDLILWGTIR